MTRQLRRDEVTPETWAIVAGRPDPVPGATLNTPVVPVSTYVLGATLRETREMRVQRDQEQAGISADEWEPLRAAWRDLLDADGRFTHVVRFLDEDIDPDAEETRDERFEFGLDCVLDGIAVKIAQISRPPSA